MKQELTLENDYAFFHEDKEWSFFSQREREIHLINNWKRSHNLNVWLRTVIKPQDKFNVKYTPNHHNFHEIFVYSTNCHYVA